MAVSEEAKIHALLDLITHTEIGDFTLRQCDAEPPTIFMALGWHATDPTKYVIGAGLEGSEAMLLMLERLFDGAECLDCKRMMTMQDEPWEGDRSMRDAGTALGFDTCDVYYQPVVNRFFRACDAAGRAATN